MDLDAFVDRVRRSTRHATLYHFTDSRNIPSIRQHGLLSWRSPSDSQIPVPAPGGNQWSHDADQMRGMDAYVHLCFMSRHPMAYCAGKEGRIGEVVWLKIAPDVLRLPNVMMSEDVANKRGVVSEAASKMLDRLDLEVVYEWMDWSDHEVNARLRAAEKYEVLVPHCVPQDYLLS